MTARFRPADALTVGFCLLLVLLTIFFHERIPSADKLILIYSSLILFQTALVSVGRINAFLSWTYDMIFPVVTVLIIFDTLGLIVHRVNPQDLDYFLIRLDYLLFGLYPTVSMENFAHPLVTDTLQIAYSTYYFLAVAVGVAVRLKGTERDFEKTVFFILLCYYLSYVGYILVPALGPRYAMEHLHQAKLEGFLVSDPVQRVLNLLEGVKRDAFPSGHTAVALTVLYLAYGHARTLFWILLIPVLLLVAATVYCRYHYVVDVIGGVLLAVVTIAAGELYYKVIAQRHGTSPQQSQGRYHP